MDRTLKTRISLLYKTQAEWSAVGSTFIPLKGELCFCEIDGKSPKFKVGNGTDNYNTLPFADTEEAVRIFPVSQYGFDTNIRVNQHVTGKELIDAVIDTIENKHLVPVIKAGEYKFVVSEILNNSEGGDDTTAFVCLGSNIDATKPLAEIKPFSEKVVFITSTALGGDTYTFYSNDKDHVTTQELTEKLALKADKTLVESIVDILNGLVNEVEILDQVANVKIQLADNFVSSILVNNSQNDLRLYLPTNCFELKEHTEGSDQLYGKLRIYLLNTDKVLPDNIPASICMYKSGNYENYAEEFIAKTPISLKEDPDSGKQYAEFAILLATWDSVNNKWVEESTKVTDEYYPNYGMLIEWYDDQNRIIDSYSRRISISDFTHFYNNKDWYAVGDQKTATDNLSIIYNSQEKLSIKGFNAATQGQMLVRDNVAGTAWVTPLSDAQLQEAVSLASQSASAAAGYANTAADAAIEAKQSEIAIKNFIWRGTLAQYNALETIDPETVYIIIT